MRPPASTATDWRSRVYAGSSSASSGRRARPPARIRVDVLERQANRCLYCGLPFETEVMRAGRTIVLRVEWDHVRPFAYLATNPEDNWCAACQVCNRLKAGRTFDSVVAAVEAVRAARRRKGYYP